MSAAERSRFFTRKKVQQLNAKVEKKSSPKIKFNIA